MSDLGVISKKRVERPSQREDKGEFSVGFCISAAQRLSDFRQKEVALIEPLADYIKGEMTKTRNVIKDSLKRIQHEDGVRNLDPKEDISKLTMIEKRWLDVLGYLQERQDKIVGSIDASEQSIQENLDVLTQKQDNLHKRVGSSALGRMYRELELDVQNEILAEQKRLCTVRYDSLNDVKKCLYDIKERMYRCHIYQVTRRGTWQNLHATDDHMKLIWHRSYVVHSFDALTEIILLLEKLDDMFCGKETSMQKFADINLKILGHINNFRSCMQEAENTLRNVEVIGYENSLVVAAVSLLDRIVVAQIEDGIDYVIELVKELSKKFSRFRMKKSGLKKTFDNINSIKQFADTSTKIQVDLINAKLVAPKTHYLEVLLKIEGKQGQAQYKTIYEALNHDINLYAAKAKKSPDCFLDTKQLQLGKIDINLEGLGDEIFNGAYHSRFTKIEEETFNYKILKLLELNTMLDKWQIMDNIDIFTRSERQLERMCDAQLTRRRYLIESLNALILVVKNRQEQNSTYEKGMEDFEQYLMRISDAKRQ